MRRVSLKRQKLLRKVGPIRDAFRVELAICERCLRRSPILHEIARGCTRSQSLTARFAILGLCDPGCHQIVGEWPRARQLALVRLRRPNDFDLEAYWELIRRRSPDLDEVMFWVEKLKEELP